MTKTQEKPKTFAQMTRRERAVAVATDVIEQLDKKRGSYRLNGGYLGQNDGTALFPVGGDLQQCADQAQRSCSVCAIGALLISKARLFNHVPISRLAATNFYGEPGQLGAGRDTIIELLDGVFTESQAAMIEAAFETTNVFTSMDASKAVAFGLQHQRSHKARLRAIMQNIVDNDGVFKPGSKEGGK